MQSSIVPKPWGWEYCAFDNGLSAVWILHIARGRKTSYHCHPKKRTQLIALHGEVLFNGSPLRELDTVVVQQGEYHQTAVGEFETASQDGAFVMEIEEPSDKGDIIRAEDAYGREGKPIEAETISYAGDLLKLTAKPQSLMGYTFKLERSLGAGTRAPDLGLSFGGEILGIYRDAEKKVSDCVADFVRAQGIEHVFGVVGGGSMHLNDSFREIFHAVHHEQAAAMAADAYGRLRGLGCALLTTGPGGTNAITGLCCSWIDSIPVLFISGQVTTNTLMGGTGLRQRGIQETDIVSMVKSVTKYAATVMRAEDIRFQLERALWYAKSGRPGPVWIDIPLDVQGKLVNWDKLQRFVPPEEFAPNYSLSVRHIYDCLRAARRPVLVLGNGVHISGGEEEAEKLAAHLGIPVLTSWTAGDIMHDHPLHIGHFGIFGDRASNFTVQNADLLLVIGSRLSIAQTGYNVAQFARGAKIVMVDQDEAEMKKSGYAVKADAKHFMRELLKVKHDWRHAEWLMRCEKWRQNYPVIAEHKVTPGYTNSFHFIERLCKELPPDAVVVTDMGTAFTCTFQAAKMKRGQRWLTASGHAPMGYGLPGAIGAHYATGKPVTCIVGDGALMFNLQDLKTIGDNNLPIRIIVLDNGGYLTMKHTQMNHFGRLVGAEFENPQWDDLFELFGVDGEVVYMDPLQALIPRSSSQKLPDGRISSKPLEDLYPFLPREEFRAQMVVPPIEALE